MSDLWDNAEIVAGGQRMVFELGERRYGYLSEEPVQAFTALWDSKSWRWELEHFEPGVRVVYRRLGRVDKALTTGVA